MNDRKTARFWPLVLGLFLLGVVLWFQPFTHDRAPDDATAEPNPVVDLAAEQERGIHAVSPGPSRDAKRSDPPAMPKASTIAELLELEPDAMATGEQNFETLLLRLEAGHDDAARDFAFRWKACRQLLENHTFRRLIAHGSLTGYLESMQNWSHRTPSSGGYLRSVENFVGDLMEQMPECLPYYQHATAELRARLESLAEQGNVAARAAYAMWPPHRDLVYATTEEQRYWEIRALEFSLANLEAGELLGFEVFAKSYGGQRYFSPSHHVTSIVFLVAMLRCGFDLSREFREQLIGFADRRGYENMPLIMAEKLVIGSQSLRRYCRSGTWWEHDRTMEFLLGLSTS